MVVAHSGVADHSKGCIHVEQIRFHSHFTVYKRSVGGVVDARPAPGTRDGVFFVLVRDGVLQPAHGAHEIGSNVASCSKEIKVAPSWSDSVVWFSARWPLPVA